MPRELLLLIDASCVPEHVSLTDASHSWSVDTPSHTRRRSSLSLPQMAGATLSWVGHHSVDTSALLHHLLEALTPSSYQQRAVVIFASGNRDSRSPRAEVNRREPRPPHLCVPAQAFVTALSHPPHPLLNTTKHHTRAGPWRAGTTEAVVATLSCVAIPELTIIVSSPALDAPVVLRSAASLMQPEDGAGSLQGGFLQAPYRISDLPASSLALCLARATASAHTYSATPHLV